MPGATISTARILRTLSTRSGSQAPIIVILNETPEPSMSHAADMHIHNRTSIPYRRQPFLQFGLPGAVAQRLAANVLQGFEKLSRRGKQAWKKRKSFIQLMLGYTLLCKVSIY
jgi:hypothetical protein